MEVLEVIRCMVLCMLEVPEVMRYVLLCTLETDSLFAGGYC